MLRKFRSDQRGNVAVIMGLAMIPVLGLAAVALDYSRGAAVRTEMQAALDAAVLDVAQSATGMTAATLTQAVQKQFAARFDVTKVSNFNLSVSNSAGSVAATATGDVPATLVQVLNIKKLSIGASSTATWGDLSLEISLVLDNTGSMADTLGSTTKIKALTTAAKNFVSYMQANVPPSSSVKIAIVPFDTDVNIGPGNQQASWLDLSSIAGLNGNGNHGVNQFLQQLCSQFGSQFSQLCQSSSSANWQGCIWDRAQPNDVTNAVPVAGSAATLYQPDPNRLSNCGLAPMQPLTSSWGTLNSTINQMKASGSTNLTLGLAWGYNMLTPNAPFAGATAFGTPNVVKVIVFMTDGWNTQNRWSQAQSQIDPRTSQVCTNIKSAGVQLCAIGTSDADTGLLQGCASSSAMFYSISDGSQLDPVFQKIAGQIAKLRLSK